MILTHLALFSFLNGAGTAAAFVPTPGFEKGINDAAISAARRYSFLTGDLNGPILSWDEFPLSVPPSTPTWTDPATPNSPTWNNPGAAGAVTLANERGINDVPIAAARNYSFLTGEINGPILSWDEFPLDKPPSAPTWTSPESPNPPTWNQP